MPCASSRFKNVQKYAKRRATNTSVAPVDTTLEKDDLRPTVEETESVNLLGMTLAA